VSAIAISASSAGCSGALLADDKVRTTKTFTAALSAVETNYVDKVDSDRLVYAPWGVLSTWIAFDFYDPPVAQMPTAEGHYYASEFRSPPAMGCDAQLVFDRIASYKQGSQGDGSRECGRRHEELDCLTPSSAPKCDEELPRRARTPVQISLRRSVTKKADSRRLVPTKSLIQRFRRIHDRPDHGYVQLRDFGETTDATCGAPFIADVERHAPVAHIRNILAVARSGH